MLGPADLSAASVVTATQSSAQVGVKRAVPVMADAAAPVKRLRADHTYPVHAPAVGRGTGGANILCSDMTPSPFALLLLAAKNAACQPMAPPKNVA